MSEKNENTPTPDTIRTALGSLRAVNAELDELESALCNAINEAQDTDAKALLERELSAIQSGRKDDHEIGNAALQQLIEDAELGWEIDREAMTVTIGTATPIEETTYEYSYDEGTDRIWCQPAPEPTAV